MPHEHRTAAIISAGDELTLGQKLDTNSKWIAERLVGMGIVPIEHATVPDDRAAHASAFSRLAAGADLIVCTGGLGPTADDLTRHALADATGDTLVEDAEALRQIEAWFAARGRRMGELNRTQALRPSRGLVLPNAHGTAPGLTAGLSRPSACDVFCLPGPPAEMQPMFETHVAPRLRPPAGRAVRTRVLHCVGIGESDLAARLGTLMARERNPTVGTTASGGVVSVRLRFQGAGSPRQADDALDADERAVRGLVGDFIFGAGDDTLAQAVVRELAAQGRTLVVAESCTGGLLGGTLTAAPGSSAVFAGGWIAYDNRVKTGALGVPAGLLAAHGAVSREVAAAMAEGALRSSPAPAHAALAVTGVAGPDGGTPDKPVGTVWIALARAGEAIDARRFSMGGDRESVRRWSVLAALGVLWMHLRGRPGVRLLRQTE
jgi:nicotinamide-nucleotide amidase